MMLSAEHLAAYLKTTVPDGPTEFMGMIADAVIDFAKEAVADEREQCALIADCYSQVYGTARIVGNNIGHMIRLRSQRPAMQCACYIAESLDGHPLRLNPCPEHERWAKAIRDVERDRCAKTSRALWKDPEGAYTADYVENDALYRLLMAIGLEAKDLPERLDVIIDEAVAYGLHEVPEYTPLVHAMERAAMAQRDMRGSI